MSHSEFERLLGAYAVNSVEPDERSRIEEHLSTCEACRDEVAEHRRALSRLAEAEIAAPAGLWEKIEKSLEETPPPLDLMRPRRSSVFTRIAALAAAAAIIVALGVRVVQQDSRITALETQAGEDGLMRAAASAAADPAAERITLRSSDETLAVDAVLLPDGRAFFVSNNLPKLVQAETYQLWALVSGSRVSLGVMRGGPGVVAFRAPPESDALAITIEKSGGVTSSNQAPVVVGLRK